MANLLPLVGVFLWGWKLSDLIVLYWFESGVVGAYTVAKIALVRTDGPDRALRLLLKLFCTPFFIGHYGLFWLVHGVFVVFFFTEIDIMLTTGPAEALQAVLAETGERLQRLIWPFVGIVVSHGAAFFSNFLENDEERHALPIQFMFQPYGRVVVLHVTTMVAAFMLLQVGAPPIALIVFITVKILVDVVAHQWEHRVTLRRFMHATKISSGINPEINLEVNNEGAPA